MSNEGLPITAFKVGNRVRGEISSSERFFGVVVRVGNLFGGDKGLVVKRDLGGEWSCVEIDGIVQSALGARTESTKPLRLLSPRKIRWI